MQRVKNKKKHKINVKQNFNKMFLLKLALCSVSVSNNSGNIGSFCDFIPTTKFKQKDLK